MEPAKTEQQIRPISIEKVKVASTSLEIPPEGSMSHGHIYLNPRVACAQPRPTAITHDGKHTHVHRHVLPGYQESMLRQLCLTQAGSSIYAKDESNRYGLPAFKVLGSSFACFVQLCRVWQLDAYHTTLAELRACAASAAHPHPVLVCATDGNHGRGLAWLARTIGLAAHIFVPSTVAASSVQKIASEGANVQQLDVDYDSAVKHASRHADSLPHALLIQDTAWSGYTEIPRHIVQGYATIFDELALQLPDATHIICPVGVGSLAQACVLYAQPNITVIAVEPTAAPCLFHSLEQDKIVPVMTRQTVMPGLNCGLVSYDAWPHLRNSIAAAVLVEDNEVLQAVNDMHSQGVMAGPCGGATLAALRHLLCSTDACTVLRLDATSKIVLLVTEGSEVETNASLQQSLNCLNITRTL